MKITITKVKCLRCGHQWVPRIEEPKTCSKCRSPYWDIPRRERKNLILEISQRFRALQVQIKTNSKKREKEPNPRKGIETRL